MKTTLTKQTSRLAHIGSLTCAIHCIITPILVMFLPVIGGYYHNHWIEWGLLLGAILCGTLIVFNGFCKHKKKHASILFAIGTTFWLLNSINETFHVMSHHHLFLYVGTACVLLSYKLNHTYLNCCTAQCCESLNKDA